MTGNYTINGQSLAALGFIPGRLSSGSGVKSHLALEGNFSVPKREGKCYHLWADGVEPYADPDDIAFAPREMSLSLVAKAASLNALRIKLNDLAASLDDRFTLSAFGESYAVTLLSWKVTHFSNGWGSVVMKLSEDNPVITFSPGHTVPAALSAPGIDGLAWADLGLVVKELGGRYDLADLKVYKLTNPADVRGCRKEIFITLSGTVKAKNLADFKAKLLGLRTVICSPGVHRLRYFDGTAIDFISTESLKIDDIREFASGNIWASFTCKLLKI